MPTATVRRLFAPLFVLCLLAAACSSSGTTDTDGASASTTTPDTDQEITPDDPQEITPETPQEIDPVDVERLGLSLTGAAMTADNLSCVLARSEDDRTLTAALTGVAVEGFAFDDQTFSAVTGAMHACVDTDVLVASVLALSGATGDTESVAYSECIAERITEPLDGDLTYTGLAAMNVGFPVPGGASESTIDAVRSCVSPESLASELAASTEQGSGFLLVVDRECVAAELTPEFLDDFWPTVVNATGQTTELQDTLDACSTEYSSGLPTEIPADFVPWSGEGTLAGIDPASRNRAYTSAPPMNLVDGEDYFAIIETADGTMKIDLFEDAAPVTVNNFVNLAADGYFDGTVFHRVLDGFMAQAGDPSGLGTGGPGYSFDDEESGLTSIDRRGLLAMANSGEDTNGSQFFITFDEATFLDGLHVVFGEVVEGDDVLAQIDLRDPAAPTSRGEQILSITIEVR